MGALYRLDFPNGRAYIGITLKSAAERFAAHCANINRIDKQRLAVTSALKKYGAANVTLTVISDSDDWAELCRLEIEAIRTQQTLAPNGYNMTSGGDGAPDIRFSDETLSQMSASARAAWAAEGHRERMSQLRRGKRQTEVTKARRAESVREAWNKPGYREAMRRVHRAVSKESNERRAAGVTAAWADPQKRASMLAARASARAKA